MKETCAAIGKNVRKLLPARGDVDRDGNGAKPDATEHRLQELDAV
jgi:hypothetical protein